MLFNTYGIKSNNIRVMCVSSIIGGMLFFLPILALYMEKSLFSITNVALIFAIEAIAMAFFEMPTGAVADLFGRKKTMILAYISTLASLLFLYIGGSMLMFICYAILNAFGRSLASGTDSALIYDTLKEENKERHFKKIIGTYYALWPLGAAAGSIIGGHLAEISLSLPVLATSLPLSISLIILLYLKEPDYEKENHKNIFLHMKNTSQLILKNKQLLIIVTGLFLILAFGETLFALNPLFFEFKQIPIVYFGYISAICFFLSSVGHYLSHSISETLGDKATLLLCVFFTPLLFLFATLSIGFVAVSFFLMSTFFYGLRTPVIHHLMNQEVSSGKRATLISTSNFTGQLGVAIFAPFIGYLAELYTINTAFMISALILFTVPLLFLFLKGRD